MPNLSLSKYYTVIIFSWILGGNCDSEIPFTAAVCSEPEILPKAIVEMQRWV